MLKKFTLVLGLAIMASAAVQAQTLPQDQQTQPNASYSDDEIAKFAKAAKVLEELQAAVETEMIAAIEKKGLDLDTFNKIAAAQQNPNAGSEVADAETMKSYNAVNEDLQKIQMEAQPKMVEAIEETGMDINEYQQMMLAYQQSPEMQAKVQEMMQN